MAGKDLYQLLGVPESADAGAIASAYEAALAALRASPGQGGADAAHRKLALDEAYRILSSPKGRADYNRRLAQARNPVPVLHAARVESEGFPTGKAIALAVVLLLAVGAWYAKVRADRNEAQRLSAARVAEEAALLAEREEGRAEQDRQSAERNRRIEEMRQQMWEQSARASSNYNSAIVAQQAQMERQRADMEQRRQQQFDDAQRRRQEQDAQRRLAEDKRRLQQLECQNYRAC